MKRIAVASDDNMVTGHFGHCQGFMLFDVENDEICKTTFVENPGHKRGFLPNFLKTHGADVIVAGGMGKGAIELFEENGIEVIMGASGKAEDAVKSYIKGELESSGSICNEHMHRGHCGE